MLYDPFLIVNWLRLLYWCLEIKFVSIDESFEVWPKYHDVIDWPPHWSNMNKFSNFNGSLEWLMFTNK